MPRGGPMRPHAIRLLVSLLVLVTFFMAARAILSAPPSVGRGGQGDPCAATEALTSFSTAASQLQTLRDFRDKIMAASSKGQLLIDVYEEHNGRVTALFAQDPALRVSAGRFLKLLTPVLKKLV